MVNKFIFTIILDFAIKYPRKQVIPDPRIPLSLIEMVTKLMKRKSYSSLQPQQTALASAHKKIVVTLGHKLLNIVSHELQTSFLMDNCEYLT